MSISTRQYPNLWPATVAIRPCTDLLRGFWECGCQFTSDVELVVLFSSTWNVCNELLQIAMGSERPQHYRHSPKEGILILNKLSFKVVFAQRERVVLKKNLSKGINLFLFFCQIDDECQSKGLSEKRSNNSANIFPDHTSHTKFYWHILIWLC